MKNKFAIIFFLLVLVVGALAFSPIDGESDAIGSDAVVEVTSTVFVTEMENEVCASQSEISATSTIRAAQSESGPTDELPTVFLVMLEDGVCASLSPISTTPRIAEQVELETSAEIQSISKQEAALGAEVGVWYVQN